MTKCAGRGIACALMLAAVGTAHGQQLEVIYAKVAGSAKAVVPGAVDLTGAPLVTEWRALEDLVVSPDGTNWAIKGRTQGGADVETILVLGSGTTGTRLLQEGNPAIGGGAAERWDFISSGVGRFDSTNRFAFGMRARNATTGSTSAANGQRVLYWDGVSLVLRFKQGDLITGLSDTNPPGDETFGNSVGSIHPLNSGVLGSQDSTIGNIHTSRRPAIMYDTAKFKQSNVDTFIDIDGVTPVTWATISANSFYTTPDGAHWIALGRSTAQPSADEAMVRDGLAVLKTGTAIPSTSVVVDTIPQANLVSNGSWNARGAMVTPAGDDYAVVNGALVAKTGDPIVTASAETWGTTFQAVSSNSSNQWVLAGTTSNSDLGLNEVLVYNGTTIIAREGDPVDVNGNGMFDDDAFIGRGNNTLTAFEANDVHITDNGTIFFFANLKTAAGVDHNTPPTFTSGTAFFRYTPPTPPTCPANFNGVGGVTVQDIFDFLAAWFANCTAVGPGSCQFGSADFNNTNGVTVQDIFDFLAAWFANCP